MAGANFALGTRDMEKPGDDQVGDWRDEPHKKEGASEEGRVCESCDGAQMGRAWLLNGWAGVEEGRTGCLGAWVVGAACPAGIREEEQTGLQRKAGGGGERLCSVWKC